MKRIILFIAIVFTVSSSFGQVYKLVSKEACDNTEPFQDSSSWSEWIEIDVMIILDFDNDRITINNKFADIFNILSMGQWEDAVDSDGEEYEASTLTLYDKEGNIVTSSMKLFEDSVQIIFYYSNYAYMYNGVVEGVF